MSCEDIPSLLDLQNTKKHIDDFGRLMGTGTGTSTNGVTGQVRPTYNAVIGGMNNEFDTMIGGMNNEFDAQILNMGFTRIGTFSAGATLTNPRQTLLWDIADGGDGQEYGWSGMFQKIVPALSDPNSTGGIAVGAWISRFDPELRTQVREALRRSYAEAGYTMADGSFEAGGTVASSTDVLLFEAEGKAYSWGGVLPKVVMPGSIPATTGGESTTAWKPINSGPSAFRRKLSSVVADITVKAGQSYMISDRADGIFLAVDAATNPANGYSVVALTGVPTLVLKLQVYGGTIDLEQIGGKPYIPGSQEIDCKQALQEAFYLLLNNDSATVDLKSNKWLLSSYAFNDVKQRRKIRGDNAVIYGMSDDGITNYDYLISTAWNYQDIEGVTLDCRFNPRYACALRITHGYGRYDRMTIRKSRCMIQVGIPDTNPVSLSEFMFHQLRGEENAKVAIVHGLYSVLNISDSIVPCGEGTFWKSYDCTGFTVYGGRVFLVKCGCNSNVVDKDNPYVYLANSTVSGAPYIGSFSAVQCDFELRTRFCIVQDNTTTYQNYNQAVVLEACRVGVYASLDARAKNFFSSTVGYRGSLVIKSSDILFDTAVTTAPIVAGGHTLVNIDFDGIYIPGLRGYKMVSWAGYPPLMPSTTVFQSNIGSNLTKTGAIFVPFGNPIVDLSGDTRLCSQSWDIPSRKFLTPASGLSDVSATARITLTANATAAVSVLIEANVGSGGIGIATGVIPVGQRYITLTGNIGDLPPNAQLYVIIDSTASYTLSNTGAYDTNLSIQATVRGPKTRT